MSIRIYDGHRIEKTFSAKEVLDIQKILIDTITPMVLAERAKSWNYGMLRALTQELIQLDGSVQQKKEQTRESGPSLSYFNEGKAALEQLDLKTVQPPVIMLYPLDKQTLLVPFGLNQEQKKWAMEFLGASEYGFCTSTDQPEGVSDAQWETRRKDWGLALNDFDSNFADTGIAVSATTQNPMKLEPNWGHLKKLVIDCIDSGEVEKNVKYLIVEYWKNQMFNWPLLDKKDRPLGTTGKIEYIAEAFSKIDQNPDSMIGRHIAEGTRRAMDYIKTVPGEALFFTESMRAKTQEWGFVQSEWLLLEAQNIQKNLLELVKDPAYTGPSVPKERLKI